MAISSWDPKLEDSVKNHKNLASNKFSWTKRAICKHQHIMNNKLTSGYRKRLSESRADKQNVKKFPDFLFVILVASTPRAERSIAWTEKQIRLYKPRACHKGAASAQRATPGKAAKIGVVLRERQVRPKFRHFMISKPCRFRALQPSNKTHKFDMKQIFLDQARYLQAQTHHEEQTDERISQTIVRIQNTQ